MAKCRRGRGSGGADSDMSQCNRPNCKGSIIIDCLYNEATCTLCADAFRFPGNEPLRWEDVVDVIDLMDVKPKNLRSFITSQPRPSTWQVHTNAF